MSILPEAYRSAAIIAPSKLQSAVGEASYTGLYSLIIAIIVLSGGELSDPRLRRHLTRLNAAENMPSMNPNDGNVPSEKTELVLQRMIRQGYLVKVAEANPHGDEDSTTWHVGPRGKVEVDNESIAALVRSVYGGSSDELEKKLQVSLKVRDHKARLPATGEEEEDEPDTREAARDGEPGPSDRRRGARRWAAAAENEEDE